MEIHGVSIIKTELRRPSTLKKNKVRWPTLPDIKTYYEVTIIRMMWCWQKNRQIDQWNRIDSLEIDPHKYNQAIIGRPMEKG